VLLGQRLQELLLGDETAADRDLAGRLQVGLGLFEDRPELVLVDVAEVNKDLTDAASAAGVAFFLGGGGRLLRRGGQASSAGPGSGRSESPCL